MAILQYQFKISVTHQEIEIQNTFISIISYVLLNIQDYIIIINSRLIDIYMSQHNL